MINALSQDANVTVNLPIKDQLDQVDTVQIFLRSNVVTIVAFLVILCAQLIYALMLADIEMKTFEYGMLRALGLSKSNLAVTVFLQSLLIGVPGVFTGLIVASVLNAGFRFTFFQLVQNFSDYYLTKSAVILGVVFGITVPIIANIFPIRRALAANLRNSLDINHKHIGEITIVIQRLKEMGLSLPQLVLAVSLTFFGVVVYYGAPTAYLYMNFELFFLILNGLLLAMIVGLILLFQVIQPYIQLLVVNVTLATCGRRDQRLKCLVVQNMKSHKRRNYKTALMFTFCICFLMYSGCTFKLLEDLINGLVEQTVASDLMASVPSDSLGLTQSNSFLDETKIADFLKRQKDEDGAVESWSFVSADMGYLFNTLGLAEQTLEFLDGAGFEAVTPFRIYGVQRNLLEVVHTEYLSFSEVNEDYAEERKNQGKEPKLVSGSSQVDAGDALFVDYSKSDKEHEAADEFGIKTTTSRVAPREKPLGTVNVIIPEGLRDPMALNTTTTGRLRLSFSELYGEVNYRTRIVAMAQKLSGFYFTRYRIAQLWPTILMSDEDFGEILKELREYDKTFREAYDDAFNSYEFANDSPKASLFVKLDPQISDDRRLFVTNGIRSFFRDDQMVLSDLKQARLAVESSRVLYQIFTAILGAVALTLSYYLLRVSTINTVKENVWEYGQIRAIGLRKGQATRIYLYEQYAVILTAIILGLLGGLLLTCISSAQFLLYTEFPFRLLVPWELTAAIIVVALVTTFFAVYIPITKLNQERIADMLKGLLQQESRKL